MKPLEKALNKLDGKLLSIERDTLHGRYQLKIGIPKKWIYKSNDDIEIEKTLETENAQLILVKSNNDDIVIDDLIEFVNLIVDANIAIEEKEKEFNEQMEKTKKELEEKVKSFYDEQEKLRNESFNKYFKKEKKDTNTKNGAKTKTPQKKEKTDSEEELMDKLS